MQACHSIAVGVSERPGYSCVLWARFPSSRAQTLYNSCVDQDFGHVRRVQFCFEENELVVCVGCN